MHPEWRLGRHNHCICIYLISILQLPVGYRPPPNFTTVYFEVFLLHIYYDVLFCCHSTFITFINCIEQQMVNKMYVAKLAVLPVGNRISYHKGRYKRYKNNCHEPSTFVPRVGISVFQAGIRLPIIYALLCV